MAYQTPLKIAQMIRDIDAKRYFLPAIQREFVWTPEKIEKLFDSLMRDYPINSFLFWRVEQETARKFVFYEFLRDYHERSNRHNPKASINGENDIVAILDGQQRMTSLYIGLKGSYACKIPYKRWNDPQAYPKTRLYLNLLEPAEDREDFVYDFCFLTEDEVEADHQYRDEEGKQRYYWFPVGEILDYTDEKSVNKYLNKHDLMRLPDAGQVDFANDAIFTLFDAIHRKGVINYYLEESQELDKVLNIFIRVNNGGTRLSSSDLLLSIATANWEKRDAREEIYRAVDTINEIGEGFRIDQDLVLKASLILSEASDIRFKVDNFGKENMLTVEAQWDEIYTSLRLAYEVVASYGFSRDNITSNHPIVLIAYYIHQIGNPANIVTAGKYREDRAKMKRWLIAATLQHIFSASSSDTILKQVRDVIREEHDGFPLEAIYQKFKKNNRDMSFTEEQIEELLYTRYGSGDVPLVMSLLYPWADMKNHFHIDHIYPRSAFTKKKLENNGIDAEAQTFYLENYNYLGNLQLLEEIPNKNKSAKMFDAWLESEYEDPEQRREYKKKHYIPNVELAFTNFEEFFTKREELLIAALKKELLQK